MKDLMEINFEDAERYFSAMREFQYTHNELRKDFLSIYYSVNNLEESDKNFKPLARACVKELFSLIEGDIYLYNQYNPYSGYFDRDHLINKFKRTFKQHGRTFNRVEDVCKFNSLNIANFRDLKFKRDSITHPKGLNSLEIINQQDLDNVYNFYISYTEFVNSLMTNTAITYSIKLF
jgi:hypothetical protein